MNKFKLSITKDSVVAARFAGNRRSAIAQIAAETFALSAAEEELSKGRSAVIDYYMSAFKKLELISVER